LGGLGKGLGEYIGNMPMRKDLQALQNYQRNIQEYQQSLGLAQQAAQARGTDIMPGWEGAQPQIPTMRSPQLAQMQAAGILGSQTPMTPFQKAQLGIQSMGAQAELQRAMSAGWEVKQVGDRLVSVNPATNQLRDIGEATPSALEIVERKIKERELQKPFYQPGVIENTETGEQRPYSYGEAIPKGYKIVREAKTEINIGGPQGLTPTTQTRLQEKITTIDDTLSSIDAIEDLTHDSFLTYKGRLKAGWQEFAEKAEFAGETDYLEKYSAWKALAQEIYLQKRREITGVAARPEEKTEIAEAVPDPTKNSPTSFRSKQKQLRNLLMAHKKRYEYALSQGIISPTKAQLAKIPLSQFKGDDVRNMSDEELKRIAGIE
jgi:hypothetical protein